MQKKKTDVWQNPIPYVEEDPAESVPQRKFLFCQVLNSMYQMNQYMKSKAHLGLSPSEYINEFCTIRIKGARQIGHTKGLVEFTQTTLHNKKILWICPTKERHEYILHKFIEFPAANVLVANQSFISFTQGIIVRNTNFAYPITMTQAVCGREYNCVIIDGWESFIDTDSDERREALMDICGLLVAKDKDFTLLLVQ